MSLIATDPILCKRWDGVKGGKYYLVDTMPKFEEFMSLASVQPALAIDTETSGLDWVKSRACGIVVGWGAEHNFYLPIDHKHFDTGEPVEDPQLLLEDVREPLNELFTNPKKVSIFWNAKFDLHALRVLGIEVGGVIHDGLISSFLLDENVDHSLKGMSKKFIDKKADCWEKLISLWRIDESKRRRHLLSLMIKEEVAEYKSDPRMVAAAYQIANKEFDILDLSGEPPANVKRKKTSLINAAHKERAKAALRGHYYNNNKKDQISYDLIPIDDMVPYACADVHYTWILHKKFFHHLLEDSALTQLYINEMQLMRVLFEMEHGGIKIGRKYLEKIGPEMVAEVAKAEALVYDQVGYEFNISSTPQLIEAVTKAGIKLTKYTKTSQEKLDKKQITEKDASYSVDSDVLETLAATHPFAKAVLDYRGILKLSNTYVDGILDKLDDQDFVHSSFRQNVSTGRMSSSAPNCQNIPTRDKRIKKAFITPDSDHVAFYIDYAQIELKITAHYSQDPLLLSCYPFDGVGRDVHSLTTAGVIMGMEYDEFLAMREDFSKHDKEDPLCVCNHCVADEMRRIGKTVNFAIIYGAGGASVQKQVSTPQKPVSVDACKRYVKNYMNTYQGVKRWIRLTETAVQRDLCVQNVFGRYRRFPDINHVDDMAKFRRLRQASNFLIQSTAADLFKYALVRVDKFLKGSGARVINVVHDDIQFYFPKNELHLLQGVLDIMEDFELTVPVTADVEFALDNWGNKKELKRHLIKDVSYEMLKELCNE